MPPAENKRILAAYIAEVLEGRNPEAAGKYLHPEAAFHPLPEPPRTAEGFDPFVLDFLRGHHPGIAADYAQRKGAEAAPRAHRPPAVELLEAIPDLRFEALEMIAEGEAVVVRFRMAGHPRAGMYRGVQPTAGVVEVEGLVLYRFDGGKIRAIWPVWDPTVPLRQLGFR